MIFDELSRHGVVPVIAIDDPGSALPLADALIAGGLPLAEITFRTAAARDTIIAMATHRPQMIVGSGTVLTEAQVDDSIAAGAGFALSPGLDQAVLAHAKGRGLPFAPGIMTPSDLQAALRADCRMVKFFPAVAAGGTDMLKSIAAPYAHTGLGFNPTGGITLATLGDWLAIPQVRAVGGTWIATRADIAAGNWDRIVANARAAVAAVARIRGAG